MKKFLARSAVSLFFLWLLFYLMRGKIPEILHALKTADRGFLCVAAALYFFTVLVLSKRLQIIFGATRSNLTFADSSNLTFVGFFFNNFLPTSVGGDLVKAMCASRLTQQTANSFTCVLMDRIFGLFTFILIPALTLLLFQHRALNPKVPILVYALLAGSFVFFVLLFSRSVARRIPFVDRWLGRTGLSQKLRQLYDGMHAFRHHRLVIARVLGLSVVGQCVNIAVLFLMAKALGADARPWTFFLLVPIVHLASMLPSLNGLGIRENAYVYFLAPYIGEVNAFALGILWLALLFVTSVIGGVIYLVRQDYHVEFKRAALS